MAKKTAVATGQCECGHEIMQVEYWKDEKGIVEGSYGSCTGCDSFQAEFDYDEEPSTDNGKFYRTPYHYDEDDLCTEGEYKDLLAKYEKKQADFGRGYLEPMYDRSHYEQRLAKIDTSDDWFDEEEKEYCEWAVKQNW